MWPLAEGRRCGGAPFTLYLGGMVCWYKTVCGRPGAAHSGHEDGEVRGTCHAPAPLHHLRSPHLCVPTAQPVSQEGGVLVPSSPTSGAPVTCRQPAPFDVYRRSWLVSSPGFPSPIMWPHQVCPQQWWCSSCLWPTW